MKVNTPVTQKELDYPRSANILSTTDLKGKITYVNQDFINISGFTEEELIGVNHNIVRHPDMPPAAFDTLWKTVKSGKSWMGMVKNRCKNGDHYWVDAYVTPIQQNGAINEYQSIRRKPSREHIKRAENIYPLILKGKMPSVIKPTASTTTKVMAWIALPLLTATITSVFIHNPLYQFLSQLLLTGLALAGAFMVLRPLTKLTEQAKKIITDPVAQHIYTGRKDDFGAIELALKSLESETAGLIGRIADTASTMEQGCSSVSCSIDTAKNNAYSQFSETDQVVSAVNEMSASIQEVAKNAHQSSIEAKKGLEEVTTGKTVVIENVNAITALKEEIADASSIIQELANSSQSIAMVLDVINEIAEQTNLLALNAAIEAARAGDAGRGFAVVADEVRDLANRTHTSTEEIRNVVEKLQKDSNSAVVAMNTGMQSADYCADQGNKTVTSLNTILDAINRINDMCTHIASAVEQQSAVAEEINQNIHNIRDSSENNLKDAETTSTISRQMHQTFSSFSGLAKQFWEKQGMSA